MHTSLQEIPKIYAILRKKYVNIEHNLQNNNFTTKQTITNMSKNKQNHLLCCYNRITIKCHEKNENKEKV